MDSRKGTRDQMSIDASQTLGQAPCAPVLSRTEMVDLMRRTASDIGADHYLVVQCLSGRANEESRVLVSNWVYDAMQTVGQKHILRIIQSHLSTPLGMRARPFGCDSLTGFLPGDVIEGLERHGHQEFASQQLQVGQARFGILFSAGSSGALNRTAASHAQMICCYALSQIAPDLIVDATDPLSDRERECLRWVSEGKTTEDVAMILSVSPNTVNSYIAHAMQKLSANNRAMAMATAIRNGMI